MSYIEITAIGGSCPFQIEGAIMDCPFYLRARHGEYTITVVEPGSDPVGAEWDNTKSVIVHLEGDDDTHGYMEPSEGLRIVGLAFAKMWDVWDMFAKKRKEAQP